jgi:hypothetical protein
MPTVPRRTALSSAVKMVLYFVSCCFSLEEETKPWLESAGNHEIQRTKPKTYEVVSSRISIVYKPTTQEKPPVLPQVTNNVILLWIRVRKWTPVDVPSLQTRSLRFRTLHWSWYFYCTFRFVLSMLINNTETTLQSHKFCSLEVY